MRRNSISAIVASRCDLKRTPIHSGGGKPEMCENGRRDVGDAGRLLPRRAAAKARTVDHQERRLLPRAEATVLATAENICLVTGALRDKAAAGYAIGIGLVARA